MLAQIVLTPAESKKLIAKAVGSIETVQQAKNTGIIALHPSSSTHFIYPAGIEKLIPLRVKEAAKEARFTQYESGMGIPVGLYPCPAGVTINEVRAIEILSGAEAIPIASGGLGGAEGAVTLVLKGKSDKVKRALDFVEQSKGARLPDLRLCNCKDCPVPNCTFPMADKHWNSP